MNERHDKTRRAGYGVGNYGFNVSGQARQSSLQQALNYARSLKCGRMGSYTIAGIQSDLGVMVACRSEVGQYGTSTAREQRTCYDDTTSHPRRG